MCLYLLLKVPSFLKRNVVKIEIYVSAYIKNNTTCQSCMHTGELQIPLKTLESIQYISCPGGCAYSADNPSCSCRRLAK